MAAAQGAETTGNVLLRLAPSIYGPTVLFALGECAILPLLPVMATDRGANLALAGVVSSAVVVGQLAGNLPASWVVSRVGERIAMLIALAVSLIAALGIAYAPTAPLLGLAVFMVGFAAATFGLARHTFLTTRVPFRFRARALSFIGGSHRAGRFGGPFLAAGVVALTGYADAATWVFVGCIIAAAALVWFAPDPEKVIAAPRSEPVEPGGKLAPQQAPLGVLAVVRERWAPLIRVGGCSAILIGLRATKEVLVPLWGVSIGMEAADIALVVGLSGTLDFALFYLSGQIMDRYGRLWATIPAMVALALSFLALALTHDTASAVGWLIACAALMGIGNGLSSGVVLTLGADLAPQDDPTSFLAAWRTLSDAGGAAGPLIASLIAVWSLPAAAALTGIAAIVGLVGFVRWVPRYIPMRQSGERKAAPKADRP